jgi:hypothetical protein
LGAAARINLTEEVDKVTSKLTKTGTYSAKSAHRAFFLGRTNAVAAKELWSAGAPLMHKMQMWFALKDRLWTADRLARRGMDHPTACVLCCQEPDTGPHIALQCSFSREIWYHILLGYRLHRFTPTVDSELADWWSSLSDAVPKENRKELNALVTLVLVSRCIWLERNSRVFDKFATLPMPVIRRIKEEFEQWRRAKLCGVFERIE